MAEGGGFEPPTPFGEHDFQSCALNHSAIPPEPYVGMNALLNRPSPRGQASGYLILGEAGSHSELVPYSPHSQPLSANIAK